MIAVRPCVSPPPQLNGRNLCAALGSLSKVGSCESCLEHTLTTLHTRAPHLMASLRIPGRFAMRSLLVSLLVGGSSAFYLPGVAPYEYAQDERVEIKVNKLSSTKTQVKNRLFDTAVLPQPAV